MTGVCLVERLPNLPLCTRRVSRLANEDHKERHARVLGTLGGGDCRLKSKFLLSGNWFNSQDNKSGRCDATSSCSWKLSENGKEQNCSYFVDQKRCSHSCCDFAEGKILQRYRVSRGFVDVCGQLCEWRFSH